MVQEKSQAGALVTQGRKSRSQGLAAALVSVVLHGVALWFLDPARTHNPLPTPPENTPVEIWNEVDLKALLAPPETVTRTDPRPPLAAEPENPTLQSEAEGTIRPPAMRSQTVLNDPRSRAMRQALMSFDPATRMEQLCGIEAMAQIGALEGQAFLPDRLVAYATADTTVEGSAIRAEGAAFRSRKRWYRLRFTCRLSEDGQQVVALDFAPGTPIPRRLWERYGLPPEY